MKIPSEQSELQGFIEYIISICLASREDRRSLYEKRRRYFNFGQSADTKAKHNRLKAHIGLVSSMLFSPDSLNYSLAAPRNANELEIEQITALQDSWNQDVQDDGLADVVAEAVTWSIVFDTMIIKQGWNDVSKQQFGTLVEPWAFGVFRESVTDFSAQPAFVQCYTIDYDEACERLVRAGKRGDIEKLGAATEDEDMGLPRVVSQLIVAATSGSALSGNVQGSINADYEPSPNYRAKETAPSCPFYSVTIWDSDRGDFREFEVIAPNIIISDSLKTIEAIKKVGGKLNKDFASDTNFFLPKENPFTLVTPFTMLQYIWGDAHSEDLIPLQDWSNDRLEQIGDILDKQADPPKSFSGAMGIDDEKFGALSGPGAWVADSAPGFKVEQLAPSMPEDLFREYEKIGELMMEASGLTEAIVGKGTGGARGGKQQKQLQITGGGKIRRVAVGLEKPLVRLGDIGVKLKMKNDDEPIRTDSKEIPEFVASQVTNNFTMRVAGHSHSPLFTMETEELATLLFKAKAIDQEGLIRMTNSPYKDQLIHSLHKRQKAEALAKAAQAASGQPPPKLPKKEKENE